MNHILKLELKTAKHCALYRKKDPNYCYLKTRFFSGEKKNTTSANIPSLSSQNGSIKIIFCVKKFQNSVTLFVSR